MSRVVSRFHRLPLEEYLAAVAAAGLLIVGALTPWLNLTFVVTLSVKGIDTGRDGWIILGLGVFALVALASVLGGVTLTRVASVLALDAVIAGLVVANDWSNLSGDDGIISVSPSWGLYLSAGAALGLLIAAVRLHRQPRRLS